MVPPARLAGVVAGSTPLRRLCSGRLVRLLCCISADNLHVSCCVSSSFAWIGHVHVLASVSGASASGWVGACLVVCTHLRCSLSLWCGIFSAPEGELWAAPPPRVPRSPPPPNVPAWGVTQICLCRVQGIAVQVVGCANLFGGCVVCLRHCIGELAPLYMYASSSCHSFAARNGDCCPCNQ